MNNTRVSDRVLDYVGRDNVVNGELPSFAWPGGYPIYYVTNENSVLCPDHANAEAEYSDELIDAADINWEDDNLWCEHGHLIESAYGDPEE